MRRGCTQNVVDNVASRAASNDAIGELSSPSLTGRRWFNRSEHGTRSTDTEKASTVRQRLRLKLVSQKGCGTRLRVFWGRDQSGSLPKNHPSAQRFLDFFSEKLRRFVVRQPVALFSRCCLRLMCHSTRSCAAVGCTIDDVKRTITLADAVTDVSDQSDAVTCLGVVIDSQLSVANHVKKLPVS